jgi:hypothetical protein
MHIEFVRSGGFAGIRLSGSFDTQQLLPEQAATLDKLVKDAGFFNLPEQIRPTSPGPDRFQYNVVISSAGQTHSLMVEDSVIPDRLRPLIDYLTTMAITSKKL